MGKSFEKRNSAVKVKVGGEIRRVRRDGDLSQVELSKQVGISQSTMSKIESGLLIPDVIVYERLCRKFPNLRDVQLELKV